jgi:DNA-directed RNA polymerase subunit F
MLGLEVDDIKSTWAYTSQQRISISEANTILRSRYLAYAESTWKRHSSAIRPLNLFCKLRKSNIFQCNETLLSLFLLDEMSKGTTITVIHSYLDAYSFVLKFFDMVSVAEC